MLSIVRKFKNHSTKLTMASLSLFLVACKGGGDSQSLLTVSAGNNSDTISIQADNSRHFSLEADTINETSGDNEATLNVNNATSSNSNRATHLTDLTLIRTDPTASLLYTRGYIYFPDADVKPMVNGKEAAEVLNFGGYKDLVLKIAEENDITTGSLSFSFFINIDGSISDVDITRNDFPGFPEDEILQKINDTNGKWTPGIYRGEPVKVKYVRAAFAYRKSSE